MDLQELASLVAVVGPTGSGKSELALRIAEEFGGEVVNCDSLQVYRHFDIGTAKLSIEERRGVPHHLIDILEPDQLLTAGEYARRARPVLVDVARRGRLPVVIGGTGFYLRALLDGLFPGPARNDALRARLAARESNRPGSVHRLLRRFDPAAARRIHTADIQKLIRAVEVCLLARRPMTELFARGRDRLEGFHILKIGLTPPRPALYERLDARCRRMFEGGLLDEVRGVLALGYAPDAKPFFSIGYAQALQVLRGELTLDSAIDNARRETRRYAKRQWTWFRREPGVVWVDGFGDQTETQGGVFARIRAFLEHS